MRVGDILYKKNNRKTREIRILESKERNSSFSRSVRSHEHLNKIRRCLMPWTCESRVVRSDLMSVCVKEKVLVHKNNINNNNMKTKIKDNNIINVKNKVMNHI